MLIDDVFEQIKRDAAGPVAVSFRNLETEEAWAIEEDRPFHAASTMKIAVMIEAFRQDSTSAISLDKRLPVANRFKSIADGSEYALAAVDDSDAELYALVGSSATVRELVSRMIVRSSNLATNLLVDLFSPKSVQETMNNLGAAGIKVLRGVEDGRAFELGLNNTVTARSLAAVLASLHRGRVISTAASQEMITILSAQEHNEGIPSGLPTGLTVAHKTGWNALVYHDAAIIYASPRVSLVLVILTSGFAEIDLAAQFVGEIARKVYDYHSFKPYD